MFSQFKLRREMISVGRAMHQRGYVAACDGNISIRLDANRILATPTGMSKGSMAFRDLVIVDLNGRKLHGRRDVSSEIGMHLTIYRTRPDIRSVVHAHPCTATGFACAGIALDQPISSEVVITLGAVPLAPYATPGTKELSENLLPFIPDYDAILLANHGVVAYGTDLQKAFMKLEAVEHFAHVALTTAKLGQQSVFSDVQLAQLLVARSKYAGNHSLATRPAGRVAVVAKSVALVLAGAAGFASDLADFIA
jgi:L-fuculose-phosphate aldolase